MIKWDGFTGIRPALPLHCCSSVASLGRALRVPVAAGAGGSTEAAGLKIPEEPNAREPSRRLSAVSTPSAPSLPQASDASDARGTPATLGN